MNNAGRSEPDPRRRPPPVQYESGTNRVLDAFRLRTGSNEGTDWFTNTYEPVDRYDMT